VTRLKFGCKPLFHHARAIRGGNTHRKDRGRTQGEEGGWIVCAVSVRAVRVAAGGDVSGSPPLVAQRPAEATTCTAWLLHVEQSRPCAALRGGCNTHVWAHRLPVRAPLLDRCAHVLGPARGCGVLLPRPSASTHHQLHGVCCSSVDFQCTRV
jgi:hypothetical protein